MALEYARYEQSPAAEKSTIVKEARGRLEGNLQVGPLYADARSLFKDVYLLDKVGFFNSHFKEEAGVKRLASHPKIRGEFVNVLREQDASNRSYEVLATLAVGDFFGYGIEIPFKTVFVKLQAKHEQLIADEEIRQRAEEARQRAEAKQRAEEARQRAEAKQRAEEARRRSEEARQRSSGTRAETGSASGTASWPPESNSGKKPEWVVAQLRIKKLWEQKSQGLPPDIGASDEAGKAYLRAGFDLLKDEVSSSNSLANIQLRAMIEYLIPRMGKNPGAFKHFLRQMQQREPSSPTNLFSAGFLAKTFFIPASLQNITLPSKEQAAQVRSVYRAFQKALHPDIADTISDVNKDLSEPIDALGKTFNVAWAPVGRLLNNA